MSESYLSVTFNTAGTARSYQSALVRSMFIRARIVRDLVRDFVRDHVRPAHVRASLVRANLLSHIIYSFIHQIKDSFKSEIQTWQLWRRGRFKYSPSEPNRAAIHPSRLLPMSPNSRVSSGYGSAQNQTGAMGLTTRKSQTIGHRPVLPTKTRHFKFPILPPIQYLSSDHIMIWSVCRLFSFSRSFTSRRQICNRTNTHCVAIENPPIWRKISPHFTPNQQILVRSQIWQRHVKAQLELHNLRTDRVMIQSELKYLIGAKDVATANWTNGPVSTQPKNTGFRSGLGNKTPKT